jgi:hypothetical protein
MLLNFLVHIKTFKSIFRPKKKNLEENCPKFCLGQDPDPVKNRPDPQHLFKVTILDLH